MQYTNGRRKCALVQLQYFRNTFNSPTEGMWHKCLHISVIICAEFSIVGCMKEYPFLYFYPLPYKLFLKNMQTFALLSYTSFLHAFIPTLVTPHFFSCLIMKIWLYFKWKLPVLGGIQFLPWFQVPHSLLHILPCLHLVSQSLGNILGLLWSTQLMQDFWKKKAGENKINR